MVTLRFGVHNQGDKAASPPSDWDVQCLTERSSKPLPREVERHTARRLKGLAIDWNPDVLTVRRKGAEVAHVGLAKFSPARGRIWIEAELTEAPYIDVAVVCSHLLNDPHGTKRAFGPVRMLLWRAHAAGDARLFRRLIKRGFVVLYGGDINDRDADLDPLVRLLKGHYDAIGYSRDERLRLVGIQTGPRGGSDHSRYTATFQIKEK